MKNKCFTFVFSLRFRRPPVRKFALGNGLVLSALKGVLFLLLLWVGTANFTAVVAQTTFGPQQIIIEPAVKGVQEVFAADLDNDGDLDVLSASYDDDKIAWYENDGSGGFWPQQVITTNADGAQSVYAADLDNDGDLDVLSLSLGDSILAWYENDGAGNFGSQQIITLDAFGSAFGSTNTIFAADLDNDSDLDVLSASSDYSTMESKIAWYENDGSGHFGPQQVITLDTICPISIFAADIDNDGDLDLLSASSHDKKIVWFKNDGSANFGPKQIISLDAGMALNIYAADMDNDGDMDVLSVYPDPIIRGGIALWFENDGSGSFGAQHIITMGLRGLTYIYATDLDNDGDMDVLSASFDAFAGMEIAWYENEGNGSFGTEHILNIDDWGPPFDLDSDGDMDILSSFRLAWLENDGDGDFEAEHIITFTSNYATAVYTADMDNDGDIDVISDIAWHRNDGQGHFGTTQIIATYPASSICHVTDLDNDGDMDVLSTSLLDYPMRSKAAWYENDGNGSFGPYQVITIDSIFPYSIFAVDLDNDGDMDVLSASTDYLNYYDYDYEIACYKNDGNGNFGAKQLITTDILYATSVFAADLDNDGDMDVLSASSGDDKIAWYENDGTGSFGPQQIITTNADGAQSVYAADLDSDGDMDVLSASSVYDPMESKIAWYENDGSGSFGPQQIIILDADRIHTVFAGDLDNDGDQDVLAASYGDGITWYENDGSGNWGAKQTITTEVMYAEAVHAADVDNDGDMDVLSASSGDGKIAWYENLLGQVGIEAFQKPAALFTLYPNPNGSQTYIQMKPDALQGNTIGLRITDAQGRLVLAKAALKAGSFPLALPQVPDGIYFVTLISGKTSQTLKWVVVSN